MMHKLLTGLLLCALPVVSHAADTGRVVEHLYHYTYLVRTLELHCIPSGECVTVLGEPRVVYDETMDERLELRCDENDDACQWVEIETGEEIVEQFTPKALPWRNTYLRRQDGAA